MNRIVGLLTVLTISILALSISKSKADRKLSVEELYADKYKRVVESEVKLSSSTRQDIEASVESVANFIQKRTGHTLSQDLKAFLLEEEDRYLSKGDNRIPKDRAEAAITLALLLISQHFLVSL